MPEIAKPWTLFALVWKTKPDIRLCVPFTGKFYTLCKLKGNSRGVACISFVSYFVKLSDSESLAKYAPATIVPLPGKGLKGMGKFA